MVPRKKSAPKEEPTIEQPPEQPLIENAAPVLPAPALNVTPVRVERPADRPSSNVRTTSKGGGKSSSGKGSSGKGFRVSGGGQSQGTVAHKLKKKKKFKIMGVSDPTLGYKSIKKKTTTKKTATKRGPLKRLY